jgi:aryl-alcohol dehydrogenase-like predicted oxidoreductase
MAVLAFAVLEGGELTGKHNRATAEPKRNDQASERGKALADTLISLASELGRTPAQVAINWVASRPGVVSTLIGATQLAQLDDNLHALDFALPAEDAARLEEISRPASLHPYLFFEPTMRAMIDGGVPVRRG